MSGRLCRIPELKSGDLVVVYLDEYAQLILWPNTMGAAKASMRRVAARVVAADQEPAGGAWWCRFTVGVVAYRVDRIVARGLVEVLSEHHPVCRQCGEPWPCSHVRVAGECRLLDPDRRRSAA